MDFGTEETPLCGVCGREEEGYYRNGELMEDTICNECARVWEYDVEGDMYVRR